MVSEHGAPPFYYGFLSFYVAIGGAVMASAITGIWHYGVQSVERSIIFGARPRTIEVS
jgi:hypothetical protein